MRSLASLERPIIHCCGRGSITEKEKRKIEKKKRSAHSGDVSTYQDQLKSRRISIGKAPLDGICGCRQGGWWHFLSRQVTKFLRKHSCRRNLSAINDGRGKVRNKLRKRVKKNALGSITTVAACVVLSKESLRFGVDLEPNIEHNYHYPRV